MSRVAPATSLLSLPLLPMSDVDGVAAAAAAAAAVAAAATARSVFNSASKSLILLRARVNSVTK